MLEFLGEGEGWKKVEMAVQKALKNNIKSLDAGKMGMGTKEVGDLIARYAVE